MIVCPPKNDLDFLKLATEFGEDRAYLAFFRHGDKIPDVATARTQLATKPEKYSFTAPAPSPVEVPAGARAVTLPDGRNIFVTGEGAATYWRDPTVNKGPMGTGFLLASPGFRSEIEEASKSLEPRGTLPKPSEVQPVVPSTAAPIPAPESPPARAEAAAVAIQSQPVPFEHGKVIVGEPSVDFRGTPEVAQLPADKMEELIRSNMAQGTRGSKSGNRAETKIALAVEGPEGQVVVSGLVTPQKVLNERGFYDLNALSLQRMGARAEGKRVIQDGGDSPALVRETVKAGWKPIAVLHFDEEPGKIFQRFDNAAQFDAAWRGSEKSAGPKRELPHAAPEVVTARRGEQDIQSEINRIGALLAVSKDEEKQALTMRVVELYDELNDVILRGQSQTGDVALRQAARDREELPVHAARAGEFQSVVARLRNMGGKVDLFAKEFFQQGSADVIKGQIKDLQGRLVQAGSAGLKSVIERQIAQRAQRLTELDQAQGVTFSPWHIAISMEDVQQAHLGNLVTLLHEAGESLTMLLNPAVRGRVARAVEESVAELRATAQRAADETGVPLAQETGAADLLAETIAQKLAAEGVPESTSLAQTIIRWVKDLYYRVAMAAQRAFGSEPDGQLAVDWFENQLRRQVFGDYDYRIGRLLDRYLVEPTTEGIRRFQPIAGTPDNVVDYFNPFSGKLEQPRVLTNSVDALNWNIAFRTDNPGGEEIPQPEADYRIKVAAQNRVLDAMQKMHVDSGTDVSFDQWWKAVTKLTDTPQTIIGYADLKLPGVSKAEIGGERMTDAMNKEAAYEARKLLEDIEHTATSELAKNRELESSEGDKVMAKAKLVNAIEGDRRNADLQASTLLDKAKALVTRLVQDYRQGLDTAETHGALAEAVRNAEGLLEPDPIPERYQEVFKSLLDGQVPVFDYIRAVADLDLPLADLTPSKVLDAIRDNADGSATLKSLSHNKPLSVAIAVLATQNADLVDEIQLGWLRDREKYIAIHEDLQKVRRATPEQLRALFAQMEKSSKAVGLRERINVNYLKRRRELRAASDRLERASERATTLTKILPPLRNLVEEFQQSGSEAPSEWQPNSGSLFTTMRQRDDGSWKKSTMTLQFGPDGAAVDSAAIKSALVQNRAYLEQNATKRGSKNYSEVERQTARLGMLDLSRKYQASWVYNLHTWWNPLAKIAEKLERSLQTPGARAKALGGTGAQAAQMLNKFGEILYVNHESVQKNARWWTFAFQSARKSAGIAEDGAFIDQVYNPINYFLNTNPGLDEGPAIREATRMARARMVNPPGEDFNEKFAELLRRTKVASEHLISIAENNGSFIADDRLRSGLRRAIARGWLTTMRSMDANTVMRIVRDMVAKGGWKLEMEEVDAPGGGKRQRVVKATTFDPLTLDDASEKNTEPLRATLKKYFTPSIVQDWLQPFILKGGRDIFTYGKNDISQIESQEAWSTANGDALAWIDNLGKKVDPQPDSVADFRLSMLKQIDALFGAEARMAYDATQTRDMFNPMGPKPHVMMDSRTEDWIPPEHLKFSTFDPQQSMTLLGQIAFHGAFGRNGERMTANMRSLIDSLAGAKADYLSIKANSRNGRVAEAAAMGRDYASLEKDANRHSDAVLLQKQLEQIFGLNQGTPGWEFLRFVTGQIVDNPKTALYHILQIGERPFAQRSLGPLTVKSTTGAFGGVLKTAVGSLLEDLNLHLWRSSESERLLGATRGGTRDLPWQVALSEMQPSGKYGTATDWKIIPRSITRFLSGVQKKGVSLHLPSGSERDFPRTAVVPGLGVFNSISQIAARSGHEAHLNQLRQLMQAGIEYFETHKNAASDPSFEFTRADLKLHRLDSGVFDWWKEKTVEYNLGTVEDLTRDSMARRATGKDYLTNDQVLRTSLMAANEIDGFASLNTAPIGLQTNPWFKVVFPLLRWPLWKMHQVHEGLNTAEGRRDFVSVAKGVGTLALWNLPLGLAFTFALDAYDEKLLHKKSSLPPLDKTAAIPFIGPGLALAESDQPSNTAAALLLRGARAGNIYGLGGDLATQLVSPLDPQSGQRQFSLDQRVLVMSQLLNFSQALANLANTDTATWSGFWRPFSAALGGNGVLHTVDLMNRALGLDNAESRSVMRLNADNWLRSAGREADIELRPSSGFAGTPTALGVWSREMLTAALANDRLGFMDAHQNALEAARKQVADDPHVAIADREREAEARVQQSWTARNPIDVFRFRPTPSQMAQIYGVMDDQGRQDVQEALARYQQFSQLIRPAPVERQLTQGFNRLTRTPRLQMPTTSSLFSP